MKRLLLYSLFLFPFFSEAQTTFSKVFTDPGGGNIVGFSVLQSLDKGYLIAGSNNCGGLLMKIDSVGGPVWEKYYNETGCDPQNGFFAITPTDDSCYVTAGANSNSLNTHIFCMKINEVGDTLWTCNVSTPNISQVFSVQQTLDRGYIMCGSYRSSSAPYTRLAVVKLDSSGQLQWNKVITASGYENDPIAVKQTPDSGYVICGALSQFSYAYRLSFLLQVVSYGLKNITVQ